MEHYAGTDVSLELSSVCVVDCSGRIICEVKVASEPEALVGLFAGLGGAGFEAVLLETRHVKAALSASLDPGTPCPRSGYGSPWSRRRPPTLPNYGSAPDDQRRREEARRWLVEPGRDLHAILHLVDQLDWWRRQAVPALQEAWGPCLRQASQAADAHSGGHCRRPAPPRPSGGTAAALVGIVLDRARDLQAGAKHG